MTKPVRLITCLNTIFRNNSSRLYRHLDTCNNINTFLASPFIPITVNLTLVFYNLEGINISKHRKRKLAILLCHRIHTNHLASLNNNQKVTYLFLQRQLERPIQFAEVCCCMRQHLALKQINGACCH